MRALAPVVGDFVAKAVGPLQNQNDELRSENESLKSRLQMVEQRVGDLPVAFVSSHSVREMIDAALTASAADEIARAASQAKDAADLRGQLFSEMQQNIADRIAEWPKPADGSSVTMDDVTPWLNDELCKAIGDVKRIANDRVEEAIAAIPEPEVGAPGKDAEPVDLDAVREIISQLVSEAFASLPAPEIGSPGPVGKDAEPVDLAPVFEFVSQSVSDAVAKIPAPKNGDPGPAGKDGKDADAVDLTAVLEFVSQSVIDAVAKIPAPKDGDPGPAGRDGKDADAGAIADVVKGLVLSEIELPAMTAEDVLPMVREEVTRVFNLPVTAAAIEQIISERIAALPTPKDGKDGDSVYVQDVAPLIEAEVENQMRRIEPPRDGVGLAGAIIDREGNLVVTMTDGSAKELGRVVGRDAYVDVEKVIEQIASKIPAPKDGADGVGFDDLDVAEVDGEVIIRFIRGDVAKGFVLPVPVYQDVWREKSYKKNALVTYGGSVWIAKTDTETKPDTPHSDWKLAVKRGRDGGSAYDIARKAGFRGTEREWIDSLRPPPAKPVKSDDKGK